MNIAARAGRWSAAHWKTATFGWLALVVLAIAVGNAAGTVKLANREQSTGQAAQAQATLERAGFGEHASENVLVQSRALPSSAPAYRRELATVVARLGASRRSRNCARRCRRGTPASSPRTVTRRWWSSK